MSHRNKAKSWRARALEAERHLDYRPLPFPAVPTIEIPIVPYGIRVSVGPRRLPGDHDQTLVRREMAAKIAAAFADRLPIHLVTVHSAGYGPDPCPREFWECRVGIAIRDESTNEGNQR